MAELTDFGATVATFDAVAGPTAVTCDGSSGLLRREDYTVAPYRRAAKIAVWALVGAGIVAVLIGSWLITIGLGGEPVIEASHLRREHLDHQIATIESLGLTRRFDYDRDRDMYTSHAYG